MQPGEVFNAFVPGTATFIGDQAVANLDYNATSKDTLALKYYYQHDPTAAPYAYSNVPGFTQKLDAGSQVFSINNTYLIGSNLSTQQTLGFLREKLYNTNDQPFGPRTFLGELPDRPRSTPSAPTISRGFDHPCPGRQQDSGHRRHPEYRRKRGFPGLVDGRLPESPAALRECDLGKGKHSIGFGGSYSFTQLNIRDRRPGTGTVASNDLGQFLNGLVTPYDSYNVTTFLQGNANRYYRANQLGLFLQDKFQIKPNLTLTAGLRYDWDGGLTEKNGNIFNFDPSLYSYVSPTGSLPSGDRGNPGTDQSGFIIAGNNKNGTAGISKTTLTGRQWGFAPRIGCGVEPDQVQQQSRDPQRHGPVLRPRRTLQLLLTWLCHRPGDRRTVRRGATGSLCHRPELPGRNLPVRLYPHLRRRHLRFVGVPLHQRAKSSADQPQGVGFRSLSAQCDRDHQRSPTDLSWRLRPQEQTALLHQLHPRRAVAAAQRSGF